MIRMEYFNKILFSLNTLSEHIEHSAKLNTYDIHIHCENFYLHLLNLVYDWNLENLNEKTHNSPGVDLVEREKKIVIQVSATCTKAKIDASIKKISKIDFKNYRFKFLSISKSAETLRDKIYKVSDNIKFDPKEDILDIDTLMNKIVGMEINKLQDTYDLVSKEIGAEMTTKSSLSYHWFSQKTLESVCNMGERYSSDLDIELGIYSIIDSIEQNDYFKDTFIKKFDELYEKLDLIQNIPESHTLVSSIGQYLSEIKELVYSINTADKYTIRIDKILKTCNRIKEVLKSEPKQQPCFYIFIFEEKLTHYIEYLESEVVQVAVRPYVLITGDAGVGKSHFIAHHALKRSKDGKISLLLQGRLFPDNTHPFLQMQRQLGLPDAVGMDEVFAFMDWYGRQNSERAILFIDALNECGDPLIWESYLCGIVQHLKNYTFLSLVLSIRDAGGVQQLPQDFVENQDFIKVEFTGFSDVDEAVERFFDYYKVPYRINDNLRLQFRNPLFLKIYCMSYSDNSQVEDGIERIFENYLNKLDKDIRRRYPSMLFPQKKNIVEHAIKVYLEQRMTKVNQELIYEEAWTSMLNRFQIYNLSFNMLDVLISEGLLECLIYNNETYVHFVYELFADFMIAKKIVDDALLRNKDCESFINAVFSVDNPHHSLIKTKGILEALAIMVPDLDIALESNKCEMFYWPEVLFAERFCNMDDIYYKSMLWRKPERIKKIAHSYVINECFTYIDIKNNVLEKFFDTILQTTLVPTHIYNSHFLFDFLNKLSLDYFNRHWTTYVSTGFHENKTFRTLIKWAWNCMNNGLKSDSGKMESLASTLVWFLASVNTKVRDISLKSLMRLYSVHLDILIGHLYKFRNVRDIYILEALMAAAYGAALNCNDKLELRRLGEVLYELFSFSPTNSIMIMSYVRNIFSFLAYKNIESEQIDFDNVEFEILDYYLVKEQDFDAIKAGIISKDDLVMLERCYIDPDDLREEMIYDHSMVLQSLEKNIKDVEIGRKESYYFNIDDIIEQIPSEDRTNIIYMIAREIFDMGYNYLKFMDKEITSLKRQTNDLDSIVMKYEWIAMNKVLEIYFNYKGVIIEAFKGNKIKFEGVWQIPFFRCIDPTMDYFTFFDTKENKEKVYNIEDILNFNNTILRNDYLGESWILFNEIRYCVSGNKIESSTGYLSANSDIESVIARLHDDPKAFQSRSFEDLYLKELYWSPAYNYLQDKCKKDSRLVEGYEKISESYIWDIGDGTMDRFFSLSIISKYMIEELNLKIAQDVFELYFNDEVVVKSLFEMEYADLLLMKEDCISSYLIDKDKSIVWPFYDDKGMIQCIIYNGVDFKLLTS